MRANGIFLQKLYQLPGCLLGESNDLYVSLHYCHNPVSCWELSAFCSTFEEWYRPLRDGWRFVFVSFWKGCLKEVICVNPQSRSCLQLCFWVCSSVLNPNSETDITWRAEAMGFHLTQVCALCPPCISGSGVGPLGAGLQVRQPPMSFMS